jgi:hypothetical protein
MLSIPRAPGRCPGLKEGGPLGLKPARIMNHDYHGSFHFPATPFLSDRCAGLRTSNAPLVECSNAPSFGMPYRAVPKELTRFRSRRMITISKRMWKTRWLKNSEVEVGLRR